MPPRSIWVPPDAHGPFTSALGTSATKRKRKRKVEAAAGSDVVTGAVMVSQAHPTSRTRTAVQRHRIVKRDVARAQADHERLASLRAKGFPMTAVAGRKFNTPARKAARAEPAS